MRRNVHRLAFGKHVRPVPVEKAPWADQSFPLDRQSPEDLQVPEIRVSTREAFDNLLAPA
jgi:hypothetical protein